MSAVKMLTMTEAAHELGPDFYEGHESNLEQWMRRRLRRQEGALKMKILVREAGRYLVPRHVLLMAFHERTEYRDVVAADLANRIGGVRKAVNKVDNRLDSIEANMATLAEAYRDLMRAYKARTA